MCINKTILVITNNNGSLECSVTNFIMTTKYKIQLKLIVTLYFKHLIKYLLQLCYYIEYSMVIVKYVF